MLEFVTSLVEGPGNWVTYQSEWARNSGVSEGSAVSHAHRVACEVMRLAIEVDQLNVSSLACFEQLLRKCTQDEMAVDRNPKHADYSGLSIAFGAPDADLGRRRHAEVDRVALRPAEGPRHRDEAGPSSSRRTRHRLEEEARRHQGQAGQGHREGGEDI